MNNLFTNHIAKMVYDLNFIFTSITFLQLYIPLLQRAREKGMVYRFFVRQPSKKHANPVEHRKLWVDLSTEYSILVLDIREINKYNGILICVDGDIFGPASRLANTSALHKIDRSKFVIISLLEHINFIESYPTYKNWIDYVVVQNSIHGRTYHLIENQCLYLGVPKYDIIQDKALIYKKYGLVDSGKYVIVFYPRFKRGENKFGLVFRDKYLEMYSWLKKAGYTIIVKNREKLHNTEAKYSGDLYIEDTNYFPNRSMELLTVANLAIFFASSVIEEVVMAKVPFIEILFDKLDRFSFLRDPMYSITIDTKLPEEKEFMNMLTQLDRRTNSQKAKEIEEAFNNTIEEKLFQPMGCASRMLDKFQELGEKKFKS